MINIILKNSDHCVIKLLPLLNCKIINVIDINNRIPAASINVDDSDRTFKIGEMMRGDKNCPMNQNVVSFPISFPLISTGAIFMTHMLVFGIIIPMPSPDNVMATTTMKYVPDKAIQIKPAAMSR